MKFYGFVYVYDGYRFYVLYEGKIDKEFFTVDELLGFVIYNYHENIENSQAINRDIKNIVFIYDNLYRMAKLLEEELGKW
jgi:hypothetical protein